MSVAVPAVVNCAMPRMWTSVQYFAVASQKSTWPVVRAVVPAFTVAVRVTMVPAAAEVTALPPAVTVSVVDVVVLVAAAAAFPPRASARPRQGRASLRNWLLGIHEKRQREGEDGKDLNAFVTAEGLHSRKECASRF